MKKLLLLVIGTCLVVLAGCFGLGVQMGEGQRLYHAKCSSCHNLVEPERFDYQQWRSYVDKYGDELSAEQKQVMLDYLAGEREN
jgi:hypothetical protein